jgi:hypothetical protein
MYDSRQMDRMRQEAIRRSQEIHSRASQNADIPPDKPSGKPAPDVGKLLSDLLGKGSLLDRDRLLIGALLLLLLREGGDIRLIIALGYILL